MCFSTRTLGKIHKVRFQGLSWGKIALFWAILTHICLFFEIFRLFLQFSILESCYIWFTISLEYSSPYVYSNCPGKIQNQGLSGGIRGYKNTILSQFCLFFEIFCLFLQFSTLESCYIWFTISLEYSSAYVFSCCPGKIQSQGLSGGTKHHFEPFLSIFLDFLSFSSVFHIGIMLYLVYN